jgi:hypothetical protein
MMSRIAPIEIPNHPEVIEYLNELSIQWKLRRAGEPHTLTLELIGRWRTVQKSLNACTEPIDTWSYLGDRPFKMPMKHNKHGFQIQEIGLIILNLEAEYGWPAPPQPLVNELDIQQLRQAIRDIEACRSELKVWY